MFGSPRVLSTADGVRSRRAALEAADNQKGPLTQGLGANSPPGSLHNWMRLQIPSPLERDAVPPAVETSSRVSCPGLSTHVASGWCGLVASQPRAPPSPVNAASAHRRDPLLRGDTFSHSVPRLPCGSAVLSRAAPGPRRWFGPPCHRGAHHSDARSPAGGKWTLTTARR